MEIPIEIFSLKLKVSGTGILGNPYRDFFAQTQSHPYRDFGKNPYRDFLRKNQSLQYRCSLEVLRKKKTLNFQESPSIFVNSCFQQSKGAFTANPVSSRSKKRRLFDSWRHQGAKIKKEPFRRLLLELRARIRSNRKRRLCFEQYGLSAFTGKKTQFF